MKKIFFLLFLFLCCLKLHAQTNNLTCLTDYQLIKMQHSETNDITGFLNHEGWSFQEAKSNSPFAYKDQNLDYDRLTFSKYNDELMIYTSAQKSNVITLRTTESCFQTIFNLFTLKAKPQSHIEGNKLINTFIQNGITVQFQQFRSNDGGGPITYGILVFNEKDLENYAKTEKSKKMNSEDEIITNNAESSPANNNGDSNIKSSNEDEKIFTKVEIDAQFPGGNGAWTKYVTKVIQGDIDELQKNQANSGTCVVRFKVDKSGKVSDVEATTMKGTKLAEIATNAIREGPNWTPAMQDGRQVNAYRLQPVTFTIQDQ